MFFDIAKRKNSTLEGVPLNFSITDTASGLNTKRSGLILSAMVIANYKPKKHEDRYLVHTVIEKWAEKKPMKK
ncbi:MAG: hypothetical protein ACTSRK_21120 [Promethearchaeota archaeon]